MASVIQHLVAAITRRCRPVVPYDFKRVNINPIPLQITSVNFVEPYSIVIPNLGSLDFFQWFSGSLPTLLINFHIDLRPFNVSLQNVCQPQSFRSYWGQPVATLTHWHCLLPTFFFLSNTVKHLLWLQTPRPIFPFLAIKETLMVMAITYPDKSAAMQISGCRIWIFFPGGD